MFDTDDRVAKKKIEVELRLTDDRSLLGTLFVRGDQRLSDLLNDERKFLPVQTSDGLIVNIGKSMIAQATQLDQRASEEHFNDPYEILGIKSNASEEEIKKAYHRLSAECHPDHMQAIGLAGEFMDLANTKMVRVNDAYQRIVADRAARSSHAAQEPEEAVI